MRQINSKLNIYVNSVSVVNNNIERLALNIILSTFAGLALLYVLFLGNMVSNILERRNLEGRARALSSEVGNLELTYLSMSNNVDLSLSHSLGFKETKPIFVTRKTLGLMTDKPLGNIRIAQNGL